MDMFIGFVMRAGDRAVFAIVTEHPPFLSPPPPQNDS